LKTIEWLDYGARPYSVFDLPVWLSPDPLAEKYYWISPYAYCLNNPIRYVDPNGMDVWEMDIEGKIRWIEESKKHTLYALDKDGVRTGNSLTLKKRDVFDALANTGTVVSAKMAAAGSLIIF